jgi:hypothetical protein
MVALGTATTILEIGISFPTLGDNVSLILLSYNKSSSKEPKVRKNSMRHLLKEEHQAKMEAHQKVQQQV